MAPNGSWHLPSSTGRESVGWSVITRRDIGGEPTLICDVTLSGRFYGDTLGTTDGLEPPDYSLRIDGLQLREVDLRRLTAHLDAWLELPPSRRIDRASGLSCGMGALFDQNIVLTLGTRDDTLSGGRPVATIAYCIGRLRGELSYTVDAGDLETLVGEIETALERED